ncbi:hypothetical protein AAY473_000497 [Plecturocebus cupreus]
MLPRLLLSLWAQVICLPQSLKVLGLQASATTLGPNLLFFLLLSYRLASPTLEAKHILLSIYLKPIFLEDNLLSHSSKEIEAIRWGLVCKSCFLISMTNWVQPTEKTDYNEMVEERGEEVAEQMEMLQIKKENSEENRAGTIDDECDVGSKEPEAYGTWEPSRIIAEQLFKIEKKRSRSPHRAAEVASQWQQVESGDAEGLVMGGETQGKNQMELVFVTESISQPCQNKMKK